MAIVYATKNGSWSDPTVWNTGALPTSADDVYSNNFTVTVDVTTTVLSIRNESSTGITAGGLFQPANGANLTCTATVTLGPPSPLINSTLTSGQSSTFNLSNVTISWFAGTSYCIRNNSSGTLNLTLASWLQNSTFSNNSIGIRNASTGIINLTLTSIVTNTSNGGSAGVSNDSAGTINIIGNSNGASGNSGQGILNQGSGTININGNCTGNATGSAVTNSSTGVVGIIGSITGSSGSAVNNISTGTVNITALTPITSTGTGTAVVNNSAGIINITGTATGGSSTGSAYVNNSTGTITHIGTAQASATAPAIGYGAVGQTTILTGPLLCSPDSYAGAAAAGVNPCVALRWFPKDTALSTFQYQMKAQSVVSTARSDRNMYFTDAYASTYPAITNVRSGTSYGVGNIYTGTMAVPPAASVSYGVPVDNTTGTSAINVNDIWNYSVSGISTSGSIGERLKTAATVNVMGQLISDSFSAK